MQAGRRQFVGVVAAACLSILCRVNGGHRRRNRQSERSDPAGADRPPDLSELAATRDGPAPMHIDLIVNQDIVATVRNDCFHAGSTSVRGNGCLLASFVTKQSPAPREIELRYVSEAGAAVKDFYFDNPVAPIEDGKA